MNDRANTPFARRTCLHDSTRRDGTLDDHCLLCGADGYWHNGHRHDTEHPSGKVLLRIACAPAGREGNA